MAHNTQQWPAGISFGINGRHTKRKRLFFWFFRFLFYFLLLSQTPKKVAPNSNGRLAVSNHFPDLHESRLNLIIIYANLQTKTQKSSSWTKCSRFSILFIYLHDCTQHNNGGTTKGSKNCIKWNYYSITMQIAMHFSHNNLSWLLCVCSVLWRLLLHFTKLPQLWWWLCLLLVNWQITKFTLFRNLSRQWSCSCRWWWWQSGSTDYCWFVVFGENPLNILVRPLLLLRRRLLLLHLYRGRRCVAPKNSQRQQQQQDTPKKTNKR